MKVKALKAFVSGRYLATAGDVLDIPDSKAAYLIDKAIVEAAEKPKKAAAKKAAG